MPANYCGARQTICHREKGRERESESDLANSQFSMNESESERATQEIDKKVVEIIEKVKN